MPGLSPFNFGIDVTSKSVSSDHAKTPIPCENNNSVDKQVYDPEIITHSCQCAEPNRDSKNFHAPMQLISKKGASDSESTSSGIVCIHGKISPSNRMDVPESNPFSKMAKKFEFAFPLCCTGTRT